MKTNGLQWVSALVLTGLLAGCAAPGGQIQTFATAVDSVATEARQGYLFLDDTLKKKQICEAALHPDQPVTGQIFEGMMSENRRLDSRTELLKHLAGYAGALQQLGGNDFKKELTTATGSLASSLTRLKSGYEKISGSKLAISKADIGLLAGAVNEAGGVYLEARRNRLLKGIVTRVDPAVQQVVVLLKGEFADIGPVVERELGWVETALEKGYNQDAPKLDYPKRVEVLTSIQAAHENAANAGKLFTALSDAVGRMGRAHAALAATLQREQLTGPELLAALEELVKQAQIVRELVSALK